MLGEYLVCKLNEIVIRIMSNEEALNFLLKILGYNWELEM